MKNLIRARTFELKSLNIVQLCFKWLELFNHNSIVQKVIHYSVKILHQFIILVKNLARIVSSKKI